MLRRLSCKVNAEISDRLNGKKNPRRGKMSGRMMSQSDCLK